MEKFRQRDEKLFPLRIQACERMVLFLERIRPAALVSRHLDTCFSKQQLHLRLLQNVRDEFEHNLSQQLFVSDRVWQTVKTAREELTQHINVSFASMEEAITVSAAAQQFLQIDTALLDRAIKMIKEEMTQ